MAIDTAAKRRLWILPIPDGSIAASDWVHIGVGYSGITIGASIPGGGWIFKSGRDVYKSVVR